MKKNTASFFGLTARIGAIAATGVVLLLAGCTNETPSTPPKDQKAGVTAPHQSGDPGLSVNTVAVQKQERVHRIALDADVVSLASPDIAAEVAGNIAEVRVMPGQAVKKGQVLVVLNTSDLSLAASEASAQSAQVAAQLADKRRSLARHEDMVAKGFISRAALETLQAEVAAMEQQLKAAKARAELARSNLAKARVVAPYDAVVAARNVAPGAYVRSGDVLLSLWSPKTSSLRVRVPQQYAGKVTPGQRLFVTWGGKEIETTILHARTAIDMASRSFEAQAQVPEELRSITGAALSATLEIGREAVLSLPAQAIQLNGSESFVFTVSDANEAQRKTVVTGRQQDGQVEIVKGVTEGERVIVEGASFARDGQPVLVRQHTGSEPGARRSPDKLAGIKGETDSR